MVFRKPYAFLIKHFKKIHILLLVLSIYVGYRLIDVSGFINDFMKSSSYDLDTNPITNHITSQLMFIIFLLFLGSIALLALFVYKKKPWKSYLIPVIEYAVLWFVLNIIKGIFHVTSSTSVSTTDVRMARDLLMIIMIIQLPAMAIFVMRIFGVDLKKFNFTLDQEFLELSEEDRAEFEVSLNFDKNSIIRLFKRLVRNLNYFYQEHKKICVSVGVFIVVVLFYRLFVFIFITNRTYTQGEIYSANGYTIQVVNSYITDKDKTGNIISNKSRFVVLEFNIINQSAPRTIYMENFHLKHGNHDYVTSRKTYADDFSDLGSCYDSVKELSRGETIHFIVIYKVDKSLNKNGFTLYYQERSGYLRKISLNVKDISKLKHPVNVSLGEDLSIKTNTLEETFSFDTYEVVDEVQYAVKNCNSTTSSKCYAQHKNFQSDGSFKIIKIEFASDTFVAKNMIDFLTSYGTIIYKDSVGDEEVIPLKSPFIGTYYGKVLFIKAPLDIAESKDVRIEITMRDKRYVYHLT